MIKINAEAAFTIHQEQYKERKDMLSFENDYIEGAHPKILERFVHTNLEKLSGYGNDEYCETAREKIKRACHCPSADIFFLVNGTQTNQIVIDSMLQQYEGVIAADTGHISVHEAGAIEYAGHKVLEVPQIAGKIKTEVLQECLQTFFADENREHMVAPGMVYLSYPTEYGTLYSKKELTAIHDICKDYALPLYIDGARLGYGLMSKQADLTLPELVKCCDVFSIGGTKVGALCGEAVVFTHKNAPKHFTTIVKQHGGLLAKGRLLGVQFDTLFTDNLYFEISKHAIEMAELLKGVFREKGYEFYVESPTNQQFVILENEKMEHLREQIGFSYWGRWDENHTVVRFVTSWATRKTDILRLWEML